MHCETIIAILSTCVKILKMALREHLSNIRHSENARKKNAFDTENFHAPFKVDKNTIKKSNKGK